MTRFLSVFGLARRRPAVPLAVIASVAATAALLLGLAATAHGQAGVTREYFITAVEIKGSTTADNLGPPETNPKDLSKGYGFNAPGYDSSSPQKWEVASYMWTPAMMLAFRGDQVKLTTFVVNGDEHKVWVEGPDGEEALPETIINRGREYELSFAVPNAGVYKLICLNHEPTMTGYILTLPR